MSSVDKIKWAMSLRDPQYEALKCFDNISSSIANLRLLTALYGDWIKNELKENPQMQESSFQATGKSIIEKCLD